MTPEVTTAAIAGGASASVAAARFWADCVRREHHGYKFNSYPQLFAALDGVSTAAEAKDACDLIRKAKLSQELFRQDEHAYWPRLEACWLSANRFSLLFSPAWYFISKVVYPGHAFLLVQVQIKPTWHCQVTWSAQATPSGPFPAFNALTDRVDLDWSACAEGVGIAIPTLETRVIHYGAPLSEWNV